MMSRRICVLGLAFLVAGCGVQGPASPAAFTEKLAELAAFEYRASATERGLQAPNRAHGLRTFFDARGAHVEERVGHEAQPLVSLTLSGVGRGQALAPVVPGEVRARGARVEIARPGLVEWYVNSSAGLEHGVRLETRPEGEGELALAVAVEGARAYAHGPGIELRSDAGRRLRYGELHVFDAARRELPARLERVGAHTIAIRVDDARARYPLLVDPILTGVADATLEPNLNAAQLNGGTGYCVGFAGDVDGDGFGEVVVGTPFFDHGQAAEGVIAIFYGAPTGFRAGFTLLDSDQADAHLGTACGAAGDVNGDGFGDVIAAAERYDAPELDEGAAFVFHGSASGIAGTVPDAFGRLVGSVALAASRLESNQAGALLADEPGSAAGVGDVNGDGYDDVAVGAWRWESTFPGQADEGAVWVFLGSATGVPNGNPSTAAANIQSNVQFGNFGRGVAGADIDGDGYSDLIAGGAGVVPTCIQYGGATGIASAATSTCATRLPGVGPRVAGAGDINGDGYEDVAVGTPSYASVSGGEGAVFVWRGGASRIATGAPATDSVVGQVQGSLGSAVSSAGDANGDGYGDLVVGAMDYNYGGAAFVFTGSSFGLGVNLTPENNAYARLDPVLDSGLADQAFFGSAVAGGGDANGDGFGDVAVGAYLQNGSPPLPPDDRGKATVYFGGGAGLRSQQPFTQQEFIQTPGPAHSAERFGYDVAPAGDVNGDGRADFVVAAFGFDAGEAGEGAAFVFSGGSTHSAMFQTNQVGAQVDAAHAAGDVNGDGYGDLIVGSASYDNGQADEGAAFVLLGSAAGITATNPSNANGRLEPDRIGAFLGSDVASAGDVNGDGFADVIVAAPNDSLGQAEEGTAFVFHGSASGISNTNAASAAGEFQTNLANAGVVSVAGGGDVNRDGYADVIIGSPRYSDAPGTEPEEGAAFVLLGGPSGIGIHTPATAHARLESDQANAHLGTSVAFAGDVNGDSFDDLVAGAPQYVASAIASGAALVFHGSVSGVTGRDPATAARLLAPGVEPAQFGASVAGAGDLNGDAWADLVIGAPSVEVNALPGAGSAYVYLGSASGAVGDAFGAGATQLSRGIEPFESFGWSVGGVGDYNGDGFGEVGVGVPDTSVTFPEFFSAVGEARIYDGSLLAGIVPPRLVRAHQLQPALERTVQPAGAIQAASGFRVRATATDAHGRARVKLQLETCPLATPFGGAGCVSSISSSWTEVGPLATSAALTQAVTGLPLASAYRWRVRALRMPFRLTERTPPPNPAHGPWRRLHGRAAAWDLRNEDVDGDLVADRADNCPTLANAGQADVDADFVGDVCDNCSAVQNPRVAPGFVTTNPWATLSGGQRDDDHDGYGNRCDAKFPGVSGSVVNAGDLVQLRASNGKNRTADLCGTTVTRPCAIFDLDESNTVIGAGDLARFRQLNGKLIGPKCATCPLTCEAGAAGTCGAIP